MKTHRTHRALVDEFVWMLESLPYDPVSDRVKRRAEATMRAWRAAPPPTDSPED